MYHFGLSSKNHYEKGFKLYSVLSQDRRWRRRPHSHLCPKLATSSTATTCITLPPADWLTDNSSRSSERERASCNPPPKVCESNRESRIPLSQERWSVLSSPPVSHFEADGSIAAISADTLVAKHYCTLCGLLISQLNVATMPNCMSTIVCAG